MGREILKRTVVVVAFDIDDEDRREELSRFFSETLEAVQLTDTVFEFDYAGSPYNLFDLRQMLEEKIDPDNDMIYMWDIDKIRGEIQWEMFRTTIG